jgi:type VI secretion system protein VasD
MKTQSAWKWIPMLALVLMVIAGCGREKQPDPTTVNLLLTASPASNPDRNDRPSPVLVRVYELRSAGAFETADFFSLLEEDRSLLGAEMLNRWEFQLAPGETETLDATFQPGSGYIAMVVAFRDIERAQWRAISEVVPNSENRLSAMIGRLDVTLQPR